MSEKPDNEHWFWKFLLLPGPPWEAKRNPLYQRGFAVVAISVLAIVALTLTPLGLPRKMVPTGIIERLPNGIRAKVNHSATE